MKKKLLVIEAHSDDSAISIGGFLDKYRDNYEYHFLLVSSSDISFYHCGILKRAQRLQEYQLFIDYFNGVWHRNSPLPFDTESRMDTLPMIDVVSSIEKVIQKVRPEVMIFQGPSFHHDHTIVYDAVIAATRPTARFYPLEMYVAENPTYVHSKGPQTDFVPDFYISLTQDEMEKKLECFKKFFPSQIRATGNCLSLEGIHSWARYRGIEARCEYAEALRTFIRVI